MPFLINRQQAINEINTKLNKDECLVCWLLKSNAKYILNKGKSTTVILSEYPRTWGQTLILLNSHKTNVSEVSKEEWDELTENVRLYTIKIEKKLKPLRCYISSLGATQNLPNTCPHLHFNIIPIYDVANKPSEIFTWKDGVYAAEKAEWDELYNLLKEKA